MQREAMRWVRRIYPHNPLYLVSAWLVLHGVGHAFRGDLAVRGSTLMTPMLCGYIMLLVLAGWLVVRIGKVWEDARTILLAVLLMFTALSTSYDDLCLRDPTAGTTQLLISFFFSCATAEVTFVALGIKLPLVYRAPFYLQLAVLFAFPAHLGRLSVAGHDPAMCFGVLAFPVVAGLSLLTLWPAVRSRSLVDGDNGTPWLWPYYPWSIFLFITVAFVIRAWMLSVSFSPATGVNPAFLPYFFAPILLALSILLLELGLVHRSKNAQRLAMVSLVGVLVLSFPGETLNAAQRLPLSLLENALAGPPLIVSCCLFVVGCYAMVRRAAWAEPLVMLALLAMSTIDTGARSVFDLHAPDAPLFAIFGFWQLVRGLWSRDLARLSVAAAVVLFFPYASWGPFWLAIPVTPNSMLLWLACCALLPLVCRDVWSDWLRITGPLWFALIALPIAIAALFPWSHLSIWMLPVALVGLFLLCLLYGWRSHIRWHFLASSWVFMTLCVASTATLVRAIDNSRLQQGIAFYLCGCGLLFAALIVSLWKSGRLRAWLEWALKAEEPRQPTSSLGSF